MKERIVLALGAFGCWVAISKEVKYLDNNVNARSFTSGSYFSANQLALSKNFIIIDDFTAPKWTVEDHLYFFLGEELYNEFWSELNLGHVKMYPKSFKPKSNLYITRHFVWRKSARGLKYWLKLHHGWQKYCKEMGLE